MGNRVDHEQGEGDLNITNMYTYPEITRSIRLHKNLTLPLYSRRRRRRKNNNKNWKNKEKMDGGITHSWSLHSWNVNDFYLWLTFERKNSSPSRLHFTQKEEREPDVVNPSLKGNASKRSIKTQVFLCGFFGIFLVSRLEKYSRHA